MEEVHLLLQRFKNILIIQEELRRENIRFILHAVCIIQEGKLMECADSRVAVQISMSKFMHKDDPLDALRQVAVDHDELAARRDQEEPLAGLRVLPHRLLHNLDLHCPTDLIRIVCLVFHFQTIRFLLDGKR